MTSLGEAFELMATEHMASTMASANGTSAVSILDDAFWRARPVLAHIEQAAHARQRSAIALLHVCLARVSAIVPHTLELPPIVGSAVPLNYFALLVGPSGVGKSSVNAIGSELIPAPVRDPEVVDQVPVGSGEGLVELLCEKVEEDRGGRKPVLVKKQVRNNAFAYVDEGAMLADLAARQGSTLFPVLRTIFTGGTLGNANATEERKRIVPAGQYAYGLVVAIQPELARALLDDAAAGTPQRFGWASATEPTIPDVPPAWPGSLRWVPPTTWELQRLEYSGGLFVRHRLRVAPSIEAEIRAQDLAQVRGERVADELDAHSELVREKIAALLMLLDGRLDVSEDDWYLAGRIKAASDTTRAEVVAVVAASDTDRETQTTQRHSRRRVAAEVAVKEWNVVDLARKLDRWTRAEPGTTVAEVRRGLSPKQREYLDDALELAKAEEWIVEKAEHGQGHAKRALHPGPRHP